MVEFSDSEEQKPNIDSLQYNIVKSAQQVQPPQPMAPQIMNQNDYMHFDPSESVPKLHTDSSSSEHVLSPEVQSAPKWIEFEQSLDNQLNYLDGFQDEPFSTQLQFIDQLCLFQDMSMYMQKPF